MEKLLNGNAQAIAELFYGGYGCAAIASAHDVINSGLRHSAETTKFIYGDVPFLAQL